MESNSIELLALVAATGLLLGVALGMVAGYRRSQPLQASLAENRRFVAKLKEQNRRLAEHLKNGQVRTGILESRLETLERQLTERERRTLLMREEQGKLQQSLTETQTTLREREQQHNRQLELMMEGREALKREFENLANRIFEERGRHFTTTSSQSMEALLKPFREQISGFQTRVDQLHSESLRGQTALESEIRKVLDIGLQMSTEATNLSLALRGDKKTTGNWGEAQLERSLQLAGLEAGEHYEAQAAFRDTRGRQRYPDFVVRLPDDKHLVIDSKVSLVDYDRAVAAVHEEQRTAALDAHAKAVLSHVNDLASKDYANLPGISSPDFVLMFMPVEPAYIEALRHNRDLFNYGYERGVVMVSHTTLMPILRTVANLWMIEKSNAEAREISSRAGELYNQVCRMAERLQRLGQSLNAANVHYNDTVRSLVGKQGLHGKVERFRQISPGANKAMPRLEPLETDAEHQRLESLVERPPAAGDVPDKQ
jgi:DNA recombination protein RmuC